MGQPDSGAHAIALATGDLYIREGFPDRAYRDSDGRLMSRSRAGAP